MGDTTFSMNVTLPSDDDGFTGHECPDTDCEGYFKVTIGTGLSGISHSYCPYCGHVAEADHFFTKEQIEYARSVALNQFTNNLISTLKRHEFNQPARGPLEIGISLKVTGTPWPIHKYREKQLETEVICASCTLRYAIYGVFAYCPDCGIHNSQQILEKNLELAEKEATLAMSVEGELATRLVEDALENEVSAFDGFGRETCRIHVAKATSPDKVENLSFQSLFSAQKKVQQYFNVDLTASVTRDEWVYACRCFQKRHLLAHKMGVIDEEYVRLANDPLAVIGRKVTVTADEVTRLADILRRLGGYLVAQLT